MNMMKEKGTRRSGRESRPGKCMTLAACMWFGLFPLANFGSYTSITADKWQIMMIMAGVTVCCFVADYMLHGTGKPRKMPCILACLLVIWIAGSCLLSGVNTSIWWTGKLARREGLETQLCYALLFFLFSCARIARRPVIIATAAGIMIFGIIVIIQRMGYNPFHLYPAGLSIATNPEFQGTIGNVDMCTGYLVMAFGMLSTEILQELPRFRQKVSVVILRDGLFFALVSVAAGMALFLVISIGVQFGLVSLSCYALYYAARMLPRRSRLLLILIVLIIFLAVTWFCPFESGGLWELHEILHGRTQLSFGSNRLAAWYYSLKLGRENFLFGGGSGTFLQRFESFLTEHDYTIPSSQGAMLIPTRFDSPHNEYIAILVNHGFPAMIFFGMLMVHLCFMPLMKKPVFLRERNTENYDISWNIQEQSRLREDLRAAGVCYAAQAFFSFSVCIVAPFFWVAMGILAEE